MRRRRPDASAVKFFDAFPIRDEVARGQDRSTFRVVTNEALFEVVRKNPTRQSELAAIRGINARLVEQRGSDMLGALSRGNSVAEADLPRFPKAARWDRDPEFDSNVSRLKTVRDAAANRLDLDPGVLCARDRLEAVVRRKPSHVEDLSDLPDLRRWQIEELGEAFVRALRAGNPTDSPYRDDGK